ncbi:MAG: glutamate 5-kinase [Candidatus Omnitrophica bacterium]|nr:glutamate 5-kinase [Candidatus Omnitrophota bacterium]
MSAKKIRRLVIKIGTKVLTSADKTLDRERIKEIAEQVSTLKDRGMDVMLVTSGAIGAGMSMLGFKKRPVKLEELQASASVGQNRLMHVYSESFRAKGYAAGQILLTQEDFNDRRRYLNIKYTIESLLKNKAVPIINENDTVSTEEIRCGDNDRLAALVADLCGADKLIILTDVDGLIGEDGKIVNVVSVFTPKVYKLARAVSCDMGTGGMATKLESAERVTQAGIECVIANGRKKGNIIKIIEGEDIGTTFKSASVKILARKRWIAFSSRPKGALHVDEGAKEALLSGNKSLLASGVLGSNGNFASGDVVKVVDKDSREIARGVVNYSSSEIAKIKGLKTGEFKALVARKGRDEVIHKDDLVILSAFAINT